MNRDDDGLDLVLTWLSAEAEDLREQAAADVAEARATEQRVDAVEARVAALAREVGGSETARPRPLWSAPLRRPTPDLPAAPEWRELREHAAAALSARGIDPDSVGLDALLDPDEVRRLERRFRGGFTVQAHLDRYDLLIMLVAGLTAALVDYLVMGAPLSLSDLRGFTPKDSPLTALFQGHSIPSDNALGSVSHTSFDAQRFAGSGNQIPGFRPPTHRDLTIEHDPLLGLVFGVRDIMTGELTTFGEYGQLVVTAGSQAPVGNPLEAVLLEIAHLLSDAFTPMGIPAPGWTALNAWRGFGEGGRATADQALRMYTKGYDSRHFLTMSVSVAAAELVLRGYWAIRLELDPDFAEDIRREAEAAGSQGVADHPRYPAMAFGAHALAAAANAGKVALAGGNVLLINYPEWQRFVVAAAQFAEGRADSPTDVLVRRGLANAEALSRGRPDLDAGNPAFPRADLRPAGSAGSAGRPQ